MHYLKVCIIIIISIIIITDLYGVQKRIIKAEKVAINQSLYQKM